MNKKIVEDKDMIKDMLFYEAYACYLKLLKMKNKMIDLKSLCVLWIASFIIHILGYDNYAYPFFCITTALWALIFLCGRFYINYLYYKIDKLHDEYFSC